MKLYLLLFFLVLIHCSFVKAQNSPMNLTISRDSSVGENTIYMSVNEKIVDSLIIGDMDYIKDSLVRLNDTIWHYIYSIGFDSSHGMVTIRQLLIQELDSKIHFSYVGDYQVYFIPDSSNPDIYLSDYKYTLDYMSSNPSVQMTHSRLKLIDGIKSIDSTSKIVYLEYDPEKEIYYSSIDRLNGEFNFYPEELKGREGEYKIPATHVILENEKVYTLKIGKSHYIYYKGHWFIVDEFPYHTNLISFLPLQHNNE